MDDAVGRVLAKVREMGQEENTLIVFFSDNGGPTAPTTSSNGPLRGFKAQTWEGGVRVPFCMQWKGKLPAGRRSTTRSSSSTSCRPRWPRRAWRPTRVEARRREPAAVPDRREAGTRRTRRSTGASAQQWAIRHGDWKLVVARGGSGKPELYNLAEDIGEQSNLAASNPEKVRELQALWDRWNAEQAPSLVPDAPDSQRRREGRAKAAKKAAAKKAA